MKNANTKSRRGFTLIELMIVLVLSTLVIAVCARIFIMAGDSVNAIKEQGKTESNIAVTAERITNAVRYSSALYTIPKNSFKQSNFTKSWSYLGTIPVGDNSMKLKYDGKLLNAPDGSNAVADKGNAVVYIKSIGDQIMNENDLASNQTIVENGTDGYFVVTVLGFDTYEEESQCTLRYEMSLQAGNGSNTDVSDNSILSSLKYGFKATYYDKDNNPQVIEGKEEGNILDISSIMNSSNSLQIVYKGTPSNPPTAIAYKEKDFNVTVEKQEGFAANVLLLLDTSGSMDANDVATESTSEVIYVTKGDLFEDSICSRIDCNKYEEIWDYETWESDLYITEDHSHTIHSDGKITRIEALRRAAQSLVDKFKTFPTVKIGLIEFNYKATLHNNGAVNGFYNVSTEDGYAALTSAVDSLGANGGTNIGDSFRRAYNIFNNESLIEESKDIKDFTNLIILITDGQATSYIYDKKISLNIPEWNVHFREYFLGPKCYYYWGNDNESKSVGGGSDTVRGGTYMKLCAGRFDKSKNPDFKFIKPDLKIINVMETDLDKQAEELLKAYYGKDFDAAAEYVYTAGNYESFLDSINSVVSDITKRGSLLDSPKM